MKIVLTADNHLNYYSQKMGTQLAERREYFGKAWWETIDFAIKNNADLYLCAGDLFDQVTPRNPPRAQVVEGFKKLKENGIKAFIIGGHHDTQATLGEGATPHSVLSKADLATVFEDVDKFGNEILEIGGVKVCVAGMSTDKRLRPGMDPLEELKIPAEGDFNIALLHYSIERIMPHGEAEPYIRLKSIEENNGVDLFAMGHYHQSKAEKIGGSLILYPGSTEHHDFGEYKNQTGFWFLEVEGRDIKKRHIPTTPQLMNRVFLHASSLPRDDIMSKLMDEVKKASNPKALLQLVLEGDLEFEYYSAIDFLGLSKLGDEGNFYFEYDDRITPILEGFEFSSSGILEPREELARMGKAFVERAQEEVEKELWVRAMELALSFYDKGAMEGHE